jgi:hypothetical protein
MGPVRAEFGGSDHPPVPREDGVDAPEAISHSRAVLSSDAVTMRLPSGLNDAGVTQFECPARTATGWPEATSQTLAHRHWKP